MGNHITANTPVVVGTGNVTVSSNSLIATVGACIQLGTTTGYRIKLSANNLAAPSANAADGIDLTATAYSELTICDNIFKNFGVAIRGNGGGTLLTNSTISNNTFITGTYTYYGINNTGGAGYGAGQLEDFSGGVKNLACPLNVAKATATPAGGGVALVFGTTAGFGIYYGSGAPTVSAAQGSLYLRSDGSDTSSRLYTNNSSGSGTTWTAVSTVA